MLISVLTLLFGYYLSFLWRVWRGLKSHAAFNSMNAPGVSVVVAARNEESSIRQCIRSLLQQSYDPDRYEIVIVDDHSSDQTVSVAKEVAASVKERRITVISGNEEVRGWGKPAALASGIQRADGEIILCTDADCVPPSQWIASTVKCFEENVVFVAGPVIECSIESMMSKIQALEFLSIITVGAGLIASGRPIICNGANIAYRKSAFERVDGYGRTEGSCDDETLMQRMIRRNVGKVVFNFDPASIVTTPTPDSVADFWNQRMRWAAKRGHYEDAAILLRLMILYGFFLVAFIAGVLAIPFPVLLIPIASILLLKALVDSVVLSEGARLFRQEWRTWHFLIAELMHVPYIVVAALMGTLTRVRWKDRNVA